MKCDPDQFHPVAEAICRKPQGEDAATCFERNQAANSICRGHHTCRLAAMTKEQMGYVLHSVEEETLLKACPGSGKTESIATKAAYLLSSSKWTYTGIAFLTFTNAAADVIKARVEKSAGSAMYPHFIGTIDAWLHGYILQPFGHLVTKFAGRDSDKSASIIDSHSSAPFLSAFSIPAIQGIGPIRANQFYYTTEEKLVFDTGERSIDAVCGKRQWTKEELKLLKEKKSAFWKAGFVTYADAETLVFRLLKKGQSIAPKLAARFSVIVVDECQDLGPVQLAIFDLLREAGAKLHFVGDRHQAIYRFRRADANIVLNFAQQRGFKQLELTHNFRSTQAIVDLCGKLIPHGEITGQENVSIAATCVYFTYKTEDEIPQTLLEFENYLAARNLDPNKSKILARSAKLASRFNPNHRPSWSNSCQQLAQAVHLHLFGDLDSKHEALSLMGALIAEFWFPDVQTITQSFHQPRTFSSPASWRIKLSKILQKCCHSEDFTNFNSTWSAWAKSAKKRLPRILKDVLGGDLPLADPDFRAPRGMAMHVVADSMVVPRNESPLKFSTIHKVKGQTLESVLLLSASTGKSKGGFWRQWLDPAKEEGEYTRFAYVASSRPEKLIAWAIPTPKATDKVTLQKLGLSPAS